MKKQILKHLMAVSVFLLIFMAEVMLIHHLRSDGKKNVETVGNVSISIREPQYESRERQDKKQESGTGMILECVKPGEDILRDPTIYVEEKSQRAYLRTRILVKGLPKYQIQDLLEGIQVASGWDYNKDDGYYYYRQPVLGGEKIPFFSKIHVPEQWSQLSPCPEFQVHVMAEAVQSNYLTPVISAKCQMLGWKYSKEKL